MSELTSIFIPDKTREFLYFTERQSNAVMKIKLAGVLDELKKYSEEQN
jgi:hypothetical protein